VTLNKLGELYLKQGRYNEAEAFLLRVLAIRERILGWGDPALAKPLAKLGLLYRKQRKDGRAEHIVRYALKLFSGFLPSDHPDVIGCLKLLSEIYRGLTRYADADAVWSLAQNLAEGKGRREKLAELTLQTPPRLSGPAVPAFEHAAR
jgi:tetratricopeptide (TPR) repeat protein